MKTEILFFVVAMLELRNQQFRTGCGINRTHHCVIEGRQTGRRTGKRGAVYMFARGRFDPILCLSIDHSKEDPTRLKGRISKPEDA